MKIGTRPPCARRTAIRPRVAPCRRSREHITVMLLGGLRVKHDGRTTAAWPSRRSAELVALLALEDDRRLPRDVVIDALWPHLPPAAGARNLRKAAHFARRGLDDAGAVVLRREFVALFPGRRVTTDLERVEAGRAEPTGELLPEFPYAPWVQDARRRLAA